MPMTGEFKGNKPEEYWETVTEQTPEPTLAERFDALEKRVADIERKMKGYNPQGIYMRRD